MGAARPASSLVAPTGLSLAYEAANVRADHGSRHKEHALRARSAALVVEPESWAQKCEWRRPWLQGERGRAGPCR